MKKLTLFFLLMLKSISAMTQNFTPDFYRVSNSELFSYGGAVKENMVYTIIFDTDGGTEIAPIKKAVGEVVTAPANPTKTGYTFASWYPAFPSVMPENDLELKAIWNRNKHKVTFYNHDDIVFKEVIVGYDEYIVAPTDNPEWAGHTFLGWSLQPQTKMPDEDVSYKAIWDEAEFTITFVTDGGTVISPITQEYNSDVIAPTNPTKTGYTFEGWDKEIPSKMPAANLTITAKWKINEYTITFDTDGGTEVAPITQNYNTSIAKPNNPMKEGYTFAGWDKEIPSTMPAENMTIKATWTINREHQSVDISSLPSLTYGNTYTLPSNTDQGQELTWSVENTSVAIISKNVIITKGVGETVITATQAGTNIYLPFKMTCPLNVNKASLTVKATDISRQYGEDNPIFPIEYKGFVNGETESVLTKKPVGTTTAELASPVGTYPITVSGAEAANYKITYEQGVLTIYAIENIIRFTDTNVKAICIANWDINGSGELSEEEAAAVTSLGNVFQGTNITSFDELRYFTGITSIPASAFNGCSSLLSIKIPDNVTSIGSTAFMGCSSLTSITIPNNVTSIGSYAFSGTNLCTFIVGTSVSLIGSNAFTNQPIKTIWLPNTPPQGYINAQGIVNYVNNSQYSSFSNKKEYKFLSSMFDVDGVRYVPVSPSERTCDAIDCLYDGMPKEATINSTVSYKNINMNVLNVMPYTFCQGNTLRKVGLDFYGNIEKNVFYSCKSLETVVIGQNVTGIGEYAFSGCSSLKNIKFGAQVQTIGKDAFSDCAAVTTITSMALTPPTCGSMALDDINKWECKLYVPEGHVADYQAADQWKEFFFVEEGDPFAILRGDANCDGEVDMDDATFVTNIILGTEEATEAADVNNDGVVNMPDVMFIINYIKNGMFPDEE